MTAKPTCETCPYWEQGFFGPEPIPTDKQSSFGESAGNCRIRSVNGFFPARGV